MQVALIPPVGYEKEMLRSFVQLALPHVNSPAYKRMFGLALKRKDFIILDNGAAEGVVINNRALAIAARRFGATELVLPDTLGDYKSTLEKVKAFLVELPKLATYNIALDSMNLMAVVQGVHGGQFQACIYEYVDIPRITTLGIPKLVVTEPNLAMRIDLANWAEHMFPGRFKIHFLGVNPSWPREIQHAARYSPHVRSVDTSLPFNFAFAGQRLDQKTLPCIPRPQDYFLTNRHADPDLLIANIDTLLGWTYAQAPSC